MSQNNCLFTCAIKVSRGAAHCDMPEHLIGAQATSYAIARNPEEALKMLIKQLTKEGFVVGELFDNRVNQLNPDNWDEYVTNVWPDFREHFPNKEAIQAMMETGGIFFGPFAAWETD